MAASWYVFDGATRLYVGWVSDRKKDAAPNPPRGLIYVPDAPPIGDDIRAVYAQNADRWEELGEIPKIPALGQNNQIIAVDFIA